MSEARVSRLTIGRLYNMGNYEHVRYEISVEVPEGANAGDAMRRLKTILWALRPAKVDKYSIRHAKELVGDPDKHGNNYVDLPAALASAQAQIDKHAAELQRIKDATAALEDLGGSGVFTDAKDDWDEEPY